MSRGPGKLQRWLRSVIYQHGRPMTFEDIRAVIRQEIAAEPDADQRSSLEYRVGRPAFQRSLRRALHSLVRSGELMALGDGGRSDPYRYFFHPVVIYLMHDQALQDAFDADPGAKEAERREAAKLAEGIARASA